MKTYDNNIIKSRFFTIDDEYSDFLVSPIPNEWWSRLYEYPWAKNFVESTDISLDAACGLEHHFKFYLAENGNKTYACDLDSNILNKNNIIAILKNFTLNNKEILDNISTLYDKIDFRVASIDALPYEDKKFDKIYCISVLEHLSPIVMEYAFKEFNRTLKDDGLVILTFDFPSINLDNLIQIIKKSNFEFLGDTDFTIPKNVLQTQLYGGLKCVRAVLKKV